jgi:hypothetical protein
MNSNVINFEEHLITKLNCLLIKEKIEKFSALQELFDIYISITIDHLNICEKDYKNCNCELSKDCHATCNHIIKCLSNY